MEIAKTLKEGFIPFQDRQEHTLEPCQKCGCQIKATQVNGPAVADASGNIAGAFFLNLWLCIGCYERLIVNKGYVTFGGIGIQ